MLASLLNLMGVLVGLVMVARQAGLLRRRRDRRAIDYAIGVVLTRRERVQMLEHECEIRDTAGDLVHHEDCKLCPKVVPATVARTRNSLGFGSRDRKLPPWETGQPWREEDLSGELGSAYDERLATVREFGLTVAEAEKRIRAAMAVPTILIPPDRFQR
jgi:hypothetical protein